LNQKEAISERHGQNNHLCASSGLRSLNFLGHSGGKWGYLISVVSNLQLT
jgi:hypothetical protein